jgi:hypothetical protein
MSDVEGVNQVIEACSSSGADSALLYPDNLTPRFFDLSSGEAGAILQKLRNYRVRLAVVCALGAVRFSSRFGEALAEERRGHCFGVFETRSAALDWLSGGQDVQTRVVRPVDVALDHVFVCCGLGAREADALAAIGLREGSPNTHPGQGTACRRIFFQNAYVELLWVSDPREAQSESVRPTRLWDRWFNRSQSACPFGIVLRPTEAVSDPKPPFPTWAYRPSYLPPNVAIEVARDTPLSEPEIFYLAFQKGGARLAKEPVTHQIPASEVTGVDIWTPPGPRSVAAEAVEARGLVAFHEGEHYRMELTFDRAIHGLSADLRPTLPLALRW